MYNKWTIILPPIIIQTMVCLFTLCRVFFFPSSIVFSTYWTSDFQQNCQHLCIPIFFLLRAGMPPGCFRNRTIFSPLWVFCQCQKNSGTNPCWRSRLTDGRWCATLLRGTSITEKTSGLTSLYIYFFLYSFLGALVVINSLYYRVLQATPQWINVIPSW